MINFKEIESKWQKKWESSKIFQVKESSKKKKFFCLEMFPYPSSSFLHMGHVRNYTIGDAIARFKRMNNFNVLYPMGYDSFGLPAENAAKKQNIHPKKYTEEAIKQIIDYQKALGNSYDWSRIIATHEPEYYKWNQYFFLKFLEKDLVYRKKAPVNWCQSCESVLANEEVINGKCWRHEDTNIIQKELEQWFLRTTTYANELLKDIDKLNWSDRIKILQRNWIGKSIGVNIKFKLKDSNEIIETFTTRQDTIFGVTFIVISPEHPKIKDWIKNTKYEKSFLNFLDQVKKLTPAERTTTLKKEKRGVFLGKYVIHPLTNKEIPIYAADFVLADFGTGIVQAVPAHDQRDFDFAKEHGLKIIITIQPKDKELNVLTMDQAFEGYGNLINSNEFNGLSSEEALIKIADKLEKLKVGKKTSAYKLRDWLISRQRYWGTPIPIIYCDECGIVPLKEKDLPLKLPEKVDFTKQGNPLNHIKEWINVKCPKCKSNAKRETDTMGGFVDSSWYFLRFCSPHENNKPFDKKAVDYWMPVDQYIGGIEHAVGHLIYSRFFTKALRDLKMLKINEPFTSLFNQGILYKDGHKMSKSFGNIVTQTEISEKYGIDTARLFLMSVAASESDMEWSDKGVEWSYKLIQKIIKLSEEKLIKANTKDLHKIHLLIKEYTKLFNDFKFNLCIIKLNQIIDYLFINPNIEGYETLLKIISPFAPHITEELWAKLGHQSFISLENWPKLDTKKINMDIEFEEELMNNTISDIRYLLNLLKKESPNNLTLIVSSSWKYKFLKEFKKVFEKTKNFSDIMKLLMVDFKQYGQEISKLLPKLIEKQPSIILNKEKEIKLFNNNIKNLEKEFNTKIIVKDADFFNHDKSKFALPGKPAIIIE